MEKTKPVDVTITADGIYCHPNCRFYVWDGAGRVYNCTLCKACLRLVTPQTYNDKTERCRECLEKFKGE